MRVLQKCLGRARGRRRAVSFVLLSFLVMLLVTSCHRGSYRISWIRQFGTGHDDAVWDITLDDYEGLGVYLSGYAGNRAFVAKYYHTGFQHWFTEFGSDGRCHGTAVAWDSDVFVAGFFSKERETDAFLAKFDKLGNQQWFKPFGTPSLDQAMALVADHQGYLYVAGDTGGTFPGETVIGAHSAFVRKYDTSGEEIWTDQFSGGSGTTQIWGIAVAPAFDALYVVGHVDGTLPGQSTSGDKDAFVRKYDLGGRHVWTRQFGTVGRDRAYAGVGVDGAGFVYVAGYTDGTFPGESSSGGRDGFLRKYDASGNVLWTRQFGSNALDEPQDITVNFAGNSYIVGPSFGVLPVPSPDSHLYAPGDPGDPFMLRFSPEGDLIWTLQIGTGTGTAIDSLRAVAAYSRGALAGSVFGGGLTGGTLHRQSSRGGEDAFVFRVVQPEGPPDHATCRDGRDNDGDGRIDRDDSECSDEGPI